MPAEQWYRQKVLLAISIFARNLIKELSKDVEIPSGLDELNVPEDAFDELATNALKDACGFTNPKQATHEEIVAIFRAAR